MHEADRRVEKMAKAQHGFISRSQCESAGLSPSQIKNRLATQGWTRHLPGAFLLPGIKESTKGRLFAAQLWGGEESILSHGSAAWLHGIDEQLPSAPHMYLSSGKCSTALRCHRLTPGDTPRVVRKRGLRYTCVERTLSDMSATWQPKRVGEATDAALRQGLTTLDRLAQESHNQSCRGRAGSSLFREVLRGRDYRDSKVRSDFETRTLRILKKIDGWETVPNHLVVVRDSRYYLDFAFPQVKVGVECQSVRWHLGDEALNSDSVRFRRLGLSGWFVLPFTWDDIVFNPVGVRADLKKLCACEFPPSSLNSAGFWASDAHNPEFCGRAATRTRGCVKGPGVRWRRGWVWLRGLSGRSRRG